MGEPLGTLDDIARFERAAPLDARLGAHRIHEALAAVAARSPERPALTQLMSGDDAEVPRVVRYGELAAGIARAANLFAELGGRGAGVVTLLPNLIETQLALWGAETSGYAVPINFLLPPAHVAALVRASGASILAAVGPHAGRDGGHPQAPGLDVWEKALAVQAMVPGLHLVAVDLPGAAPATGVTSFAEGLARQPGDRLVFGEGRGGDDVAAYFHTGGTTGAPKLVAHTHRSQLAAAFGCAALLDLCPSDVLTQGLPMFHVGGAIACSLACFLAGVHVLLLSPGGLRNPVMIQRFWRIVARHRVTVVGGVPTSIAALCEVPVDADVSSVRFGITGAASIPDAVSRRFEACVGKPLHQIYGMTEASGAIAIDPVAGTRTIGSGGLRLPYTEMRVRRLGPGGALGEDCRPGEVGVLTVKGPNVSPGYRDPAHDGALLAGGWLDTGDLVQLDAAGKLFVAGRSKDLIIRGGHNIDPAVIEEAFTMHPAVALAAAIGAPDAYAGEVPVCYVTLRPCAAATADELRAFAEPRIAERAAWPKHVHVVGELPLTAVGKIYKPALRADATLRVARAAVAAALGHEDAQVTVEPGGAQGMIVTAVLAERDAPRRETVAAALGGYLFESVVKLAG